MKHLFLSVVIFLVSVLLMPIFTIGSPLLAVNDFSTNYDTEYSVNTQGTTIVTQQVVMINTSPNVFPKQYSVVLDTDKIKNVIAFDDGGQIKAQVNQQEGKTTITLPLNLQTVGLGKKTNFSIRYEDANIAQKVGSIWEITLPGVVNTSDTGEYSVSLTVPDEFGAPSYMTPEPKNGQKWTKDQLIGGGVSVAYGNDQYFTVGLKYVLENDQKEMKRTELALPPDTAFQKVTIKELNPQPIEIVRDVDGNWMARYDISGKSSLTVNAQLLVSETLTPRSDWTSPVPDIELYTKPTRYWNSKDPRIVSIAQEQNTPEKIYQYVVKTLTYDIERLSPNIQRKGATEALATPKESVCMEFTDLFVALARAAGIATRQAVGYAHTTNPRLRPLSLVTDVLHAWPEYWDTNRNQWIPVDPTWGHTTGGVNYFDKLDYNHIVFAYNGARDEYPYPAGTYRKSNDTSKYVTVDFVDNTISKHSDPEISFYFNFPKNILSGIPAQGIFFLKNTSGSAIDNISLSITSQPQALNITQHIDHLAPYTSYKVPLIFRSKSFTDYGTGQLLASVNGEKLTHTFLLQPIHIYIILVTVLFLVGVSGIGLYIRRRK